MIDVTAFEAEINDDADIFIGPHRGGSGLPTVDTPYLFVVLPSFSFKVRLNKGNLSVLRNFLDVWFPAEGAGDKT